MDDQKKTADARAALLESGDEDAQKAVLAWEKRNSHENEVGSYLRPHRPQQAARGRKEGRKGRKGPQGHPSLSGPQGHPSLSAVAVSLSFLQMLSCLPNMVIFENMVSYRS
jgi:hypothetical protein